MFLGFVVGLFVFQSLLCSGFSASTEKIWVNRLTHPCLLPMGSEQVGMYNRLMFFEGDQMAREATFIGVILGGISRGEMTRRRQTQSRRDSKHLKNKPRLRFQLYHFLVVTLEK